MLPRQAHGGKFANLNVRLCAAIMTFTDSECASTAAGNLLILYVSQITLHAVMWRWMKQKRATSTDKLELNVSWTDICLMLPLVLLQTFTWTMSTFPSIYVVLHAISELYIQSEHRLASCCYFKCLQLWKRAEMIISSYYLPVTNCVRCSSLAKLPTLVHSYSLAVRLRPVLAVQWSYSTVHNVWHRNCPLRA